MTTTVEVQDPTLTVEVEVQDTSFSVALSSFEVEVNTNQGAAGLTAYQIALNNGFSGTEQEWLDSLQGSDGADGADVYVHSQSTPASVWTIDHNLGTFPSVYVLDTAGDECEGDVDNPTVNRTVITFSASFAGTARLV